MCHGKGIAFHDFEIRNGTSFGDFGKERVNTASTFLLGGKEAWIKRQNLLKFGHGWRENWKYLLD